MSAISGSFRLKVPGDTGRLGEASFPKDFESVVGGVGGGIEKRLQVVITRLLDVLIDLVLFRLLLRRVVLDGIATLNIMNGPLISLREGEAASVWLVLTPKLLVYTWFLALWFSELEIENNKSQLAKLLSQLGSSNANPKNLLLLCSALF